MRLLNVHTLEFKEFSSRSEISKYAITSHRWKAGTEASIKDIRKNRNTHKDGYRKVEGFARYVRENISCVEWLWIDTCCVNQDSSQEVTEAVNSMYRWYSEAEVCLAYLVDVEDASDEGELRSSKWWRRGWTLQELLAPYVVVFLSADWKMIGYKGGGGRTRKGVTVSDGPALEAVIAAITGIPDRVLYVSEKSRLCSVGERLKWMEGRETTKEEDMSYSLLGIFDVAIPVIYGERAERARARLLEAINKADQPSQYQDLSLDSACEGEEYMDSSEAGPIIELQHASALLRASALGQTDRVRELLHLDASVIDSDDNGFTALHYASLRGSDEIAQVLLDCGADFDSQSLDLGTPLCVAALHGRYEMVAFLLHHNANIHAPGRWVGTAMHCASWNGSVEVVTLLKDYGADPLRACQIQLELLGYGAALGSSKSTTVRRRFSQWKSRVLETQPMVLAADQGHRSLVRYFLTMNYPPDNPHRIWWSTNAVTHLYTGAEGEVQYENCTALMAAVWRGYKGIVYELLEAGADVRLKDTGDRTAMTIALSAGRVDCINLIAAAEAGRAHMDRETS